MSLLLKGMTCIITTSGGVTKKIGLSDTPIGSRSARPQSVMTLAAKSRVTGVVSPVVNGMPPPKASTPETEKKRGKSKN